jgi:formylglycine-generating enzyme required for sulfatase activity
MKRFNKNEILGIVCVIFCLAGPIMAAQIGVGSDFEASVKQGVVEFFNVVRQEQYEKLGFDDPLEREKRWAEFDRRLQEAEKKIKEEVEAKCKRVEREAAEARVLEEKEVVKMNILGEAIKCKKVENGILEKTLTKEEENRKKLEQEVSFAKSREEMRLAELERLRQETERLALSKKLVAKLREERRLAEIECLRQETERLARESEKKSRFDKEAEVPDVGQFITIPSGTYEIGCPVGEAHRGGTQELHSIKLSLFSIMDAGVTQETYAKVMGTNPSFYKEKKYCLQSFKEIEVKGARIPVCADHPVDTVSWDDANEFIQRLNAQGTNYKYSLPTEAQLEVAFRGGTTTAYLTGRDDDAGLGDYVWYCENSERQTHPVKSKLANAYGIYLSSVFEWAQDWHDPYGSYSYLSNTVLDPQGPASGVGRICRGGSYSSKSLIYRSANRNYYAPDLRFENLGFRLVRT